MKLLLFIMALAISHVVFSQAGAEEEAVGEWTPVKLTDLNTDSNLRNILNFGAQSMIAQGIKDEKLSNANYYIEDVLSIESQVVAGENYRFNITLGDDDGNEITVSFIVFNQPWTGIRELAKYDIIEDQGEERPPFGSWYPIDPNEVDTDQNLKDSLNLGIQDVISQGIATGQLSTPNYQLSEIYSIKGQLVSGTNYRFNLRLVNDQGGYAQVIFVVYDPWTSPGEPKQVTSYLFIDIQDGQSGSILIVPIIQYENSEDEDGVPGVPGGWSPVDLTTLNTDSNLRDILSFGVQNAIVQGIEDEKLSDANYYIEDVLSIENQVVSGENYRFNITLGDDQGNEITISFTVYDQHWTGTRKLIDYEVIEDQGEERPPFGSWYPIDPSEVDTDQDLKDSLNLGIQDVISQGIATGQLSTPNYQLSEIYSIKGQLVSGTNYRFNLRLDNDDGGFVTVIFVVYDPWTSPGEPKQVTSYLFIDIQDAGNEEANNYYENEVFNYEGGSA